MADPFVAEIRAFGFNFAPMNWAFCNGQLAQLQQNTTLYSLLGTTYGGNGQTTFGLPDLRGRTPLDAGSGPGLTPRIQGDIVGQAAVTLTTATMPGHMHIGTALDVTDPTDVQQTPGSSSFLSRAGQQIYSDQAADTMFDPRAIGMTGQSQPHENRQPLLALNLCICLYGEYPPRP